MAAAYLKGLALGFALITPIGGQNLFVLEQGLRRGLRRALPAVVAAAVCDTLLIALGAGGAAALLSGSPQLRDALVGLGAAFLAVLGLRALLARPEPVDVRSGGSVVARTVGVSLLNPHAVLDTVGVIGGAIAAQAAALLQARISPRGRLWIQRGSGVVMLAFAAILLREILPS